MDTYLDIRAEFQKRRTRIKPEKLVEMIHELQDLSRAASLVDRTNIEDLILDIDTAVENYSDEANINGNGCVAKKSPRRLRVAKRGDVFSFVIRNAPYGNALESAAIDVIRETLRSCEGNATHAAEILGITTKTLKTKLRKWNELQHKNC